MPPLSIQRCTQDAVLWMATGTFADDGEVIVETPVDIRVRWENCRKKVLDPKGNNQTIVAEVVADRDIVVGSVLWLGNLDAWYGPSGSGGRDTVLCEVIDFEDIPDDKGRSFRREYKLKRYKNRRPTIES